MSYNTIFYSFFIAKYRINLYDICHTLELGLADLQYQARYLLLSGRIFGIIRPDIRYYPAGYPVLSDQISGIIRPDIRYYLTRYPVLSGRISG